MNFLFPYLDTQNSQKLCKAISLFLISYFNLLFLFFFFLQYHLLCHLFRAFGTSGHFLHMFVLYALKHTYETERLYWSFSQEE